MRKFLWTNIIIPTLLPCTLALCAYINHGAAWSESNQLDPKQLNEQILDAINNSRSLCHVLMDAVKQGDGTEADVDIQAILSRDPHNVHALEGRYFLDSIACEDTASFFKMNIPGLRPSSSYWDPKTTKLIFSLDKRPWWPLLIEGERNLQKNRYQEGLSDLKQSEEYDTGNSLIHLALADAYSIYDTPIYNSTMFAREAARAYQIDPTSTTAACYLYDYYDGTLNDPVQAAKWRAIVKSHIPDESKLPASTRKWLDYGQNPPKN